MENLEKRAAAGSRGRDFVFSVTSFRNSPNGMSWIILGKNSKVLCLGVVHPHFSHFYSQRHHPCTGCRIKTPAGITKPPEEHRPWDFPELILKSSETPFAWIYFRGRRHERKQRFIDWEILIIVSNKREKLLQGALLVYKDSNQSSGGVWV